MKLWSTIAAIASCVFISQSALALSCAPPDMIKTLEDAKSSEDVYHVLVGKFITPIAPALTKNPKGYKVIQKGSGPIQRLTHSKEPKITATFFEGYALTPDASGDAPLTLFRWMSKHDVSGLGAHMCPPQSMTLSPLSKSARVNRRFW